MIGHDVSLQKVYEGWEGYQASLVNAIRPLSCEQLAWRPGAQLRSAGELAMHLSMGRIIWFQRMSAPGSAEAAGRAGGRSLQDLERDEAIHRDADALVSWLETSWGIIDKTLKAWRVVDLGRDLPLHIPGEKIFYRVSMDNLAYPRP